jgi:uncharacterized membrane protein (DUF485 family)
VWSERIGRDGGSPNAAISSKGVHHSTPCSFPAPSRIGVDHCLTVREEPMDVSTLKRIEADPNYQKLVSERKSFGWTLAIITLVIYYGFIAVVAFAPGVISTKVFGDITVGIIIGVAIILASIVLTGIYVMRANSEYDDLTAAVVNAAKTGGKKR